MYSGLETFEMCDFIKLFHKHGKTNP